MSATESNENDVIALTFDKTKQLATIGHALTDEKFFNQLNRAVKPDYFSDPLVSKIWTACVQFINTNRRKPTPTEIIHWDGWKDMDSLNKGKLESTINESLAKSKQYGLDLLRTEFDVWIKGVLFVKTSMEAIETYKQSTTLVGPAKVKKVEDAWNRLDSGIISAKGSSFTHGVEIGFKASSERILDEKAERLKFKDKLLTYGIQFWDDALLGIQSQDLIVLGASTGSGKSSACAAIALANAKLGKRVHYFALEASNNEIEQRIKYGILASAYYKSSPQYPLSYPEWLYCKYDHVKEMKDMVDGLERQLEDEFVESVRNMKTLYRTSGDFTLENLHRHLLQIADETDLIILDHLHYLDVEDGRSENEVYGECIKSIRDIVLNYKVPIIVVAHLRKKQNGRGQERLIPDIADFHGTSNITKIATTCIMMAPAYDQPASTPLGYLLPTYTQIVKARVDGSKTKFGALMEFNIRSNRYQNQYKLGKFTNNFAEFEISQTPPKWANVNGLPSKL